MTEQISCFFSTELLEVIRETENDDLTGVMQKLVCTYVEQVSDIAVEMTQHLARTFEQVILTDEDGSDEKAIAAMGILNTIDTILTVMDEQKEVSKLSFRLSFIKRRDNLLKYWFQLN
jgi:hypothetical protein